MGDQALRHTDCPRGNLSILSSLWDSPPLPASLPHFEPSGRLDVPRYRAGREPTKRLELFLTDHTAPLTLGTPPLVPADTCTDKGTETPRLSGVTCLKSLNTLVARSRLLKKAAADGAVFPRPAWVASISLQHAFLWAPLTAPNQRFLIYLQLTLEQPRFQLLGSTHTRILSQYSWPSEPAVGFHTPEFNQPGENSIFAFPAAASHPLTKTLLSARGWSNPELRRATGEAEVAGGAPTAWAGARLASPVVGKRDFSLCGSPRPYRRLFLEMKVVT